MSNLANTRAITHVHLPAPQEPRTSDQARIRLGGGFRLPLVPTGSRRTADAGTIRLGGGFRLVG